MSRSVATEALARSLVQQGHAHAGIGLPVKARDAMLPVTTLALWRRLASDRAALKPRVRPDHRPHGCIGDTYEQAAVHHSSPLQRHHRHMRADVRTRRAFQSKSAIYYPDRR